MLDANILIRAVLGSRVPALIRANAERVSFFAPDTAFEEARRNLPEILAARGVAVEPALECLDVIARLVKTVASESYVGFEAAARQRIESRHINDWPVLAAALAAGCPIWTEDNDFFGCGVPTWTSDRVVLFFQAAFLQTNLSPAS